MMRGDRQAVALSLLLVAFADANGQQRTTQPVPAPRALGPVVAQTAQTFAGVLKVATVRGGVFIQDANSRQLWMFDTSLKSGRAVLDSTTGLGKESFYGSRIGSLYRFRGDSILFQPWVQAGPTFWTTTPEGIVIGPSGRVGRIVTMPTGTGCRANEVENSGWYSCQVNLALTWQPNVDMGDSVVSRGTADSAMILSVNFANGDVDTIPTRIATHPRTQLGITYRTTPGGRSRIVAPVLFTSDAWATSRDGLLAIVRGADYHLDIIDVQGKLTRGPRAPFDWRRVTDDDRNRLSDSLRLDDSLTAARYDSIVKVRPPPPRPDGTARLDPAKNVNYHQPPDDWPSYWPPLKTGWNGIFDRVVMFDEDGRIWVDERQPSGGDTVSVYGIFDTKGQFLDRVKVPATQSVMAFGPGGVVYLTTVDGGRTTLLKRRFKP
jgi:hypothetical protein